MTDKYAPKKPKKPKGPAPAPSKKNNGGSYISYLGLDMPICLTRNFEFPRKDSGSLGASDTSNLRYH